ncbi:hypothetical protein ACI2IY_20245 [Lysobacter enzymogenes]
MRCRGRGSRRSYIRCGRACKRVVLGDWYEQGSVLRVDRDGLRLQTLD